MADSKHDTFGEVRARLDEIAAEVRSKEVSLEKSLDLFEEAVKLGNRCAELIDKPDFSEAEAEMAALADEVVMKAESDLDDMASDASESDE